MTPPGSAALQPGLPHDPPHRQSHDLAHLLPAGARGFAVLDLETTGLDPARLCARQQVVLEPAAAHTALGDARALAAALRSGLDHLRPARSPVQCRHPGPDYAGLLRI
jgi:hypothetical protein